MQLQNRYAIVTGGSRGLGIAVAEEFLKQGASVLVCARTLADLEAARERLQSIASTQDPSVSSKVLTQVADISVPDDVERLVQFAIESFGRIDVVVNNAAVQGPIGPIESSDWSEWIRTVQIDLFGTALMCKSVIPHMKAQGQGKIINLSGGGATAPRAQFSAYAVSKAAIVRLTETLAVECQEFGIDINAIAPGVLNTQMLTETLLAGPQVLGAAAYESALKQRENGGTPFEKGVALCVFLASSMSDGITGKLLSAVWDPWETLPDHLHELRDTDIYTLRRIIPKDRGAQWGDRD